MDSIQTGVSQMAVSKEKQKLGFVSLAKKLPPNKNGTPVMIDTNIRKLDISPNQPIYKYAIKIDFVFTSKDGVEKAVRLSESRKEGSLHEVDKKRCQTVFTKAVQRFPELQSGGPYFYDRQSSLYSLKKLTKEENFLFQVTEDISRHKNFVRAEFNLEKVADSYQATSNDIKKTFNSCPALIDKTLPEALSIILSGPAYENKNVITVGACVHYLIDSSAINFAEKKYKEGDLYSGVGAYKSVKTLEGGNNGPSLFMTTEMKSSLFHPDYAPLIELLKAYRGFASDLKANSPAATRMADAFTGVDVFLNYGPNEGLYEDGAIAKILGFSTSANDTFFVCKEKKISVAEHFKREYNITLRYPNLFTAVAKGKTGKINLPVELLMLCPSQIVTTDQMINNEQADMIKISAAPPHVRKAITDGVAKEAGIASNNVYGFIKVEAPVKLEGRVLRKPEIRFAANKVANLSNPGAKIPTDFVRAGQYYEAKDLQNWEICYMENEEVRGLPETLMQEMTNNGMKVAKPAITWVIRGDLNTVFQRAKAAKRQLIFFAIKSRYNIHQEIKALEQKYDVLTQEIRAETAEKVFRQQQTRLNIVNKTNMKLGGLNYYISSEAFSEERLIVGFETSQHGGGGDAPVSVGYAANMLTSPQKFTGGYVYVKRDRDIYGPIIKDTMKKIFASARIHRKVAPRYLLVYFNGITEGQYAMINEKYVELIKEACMDTSAAFKPRITIIASSKRHNERLYKSDNSGRVSNLEPGTVIDHTIVSPVLTEWYLASAVSRQGTTKTTKFTLIYATEQNQSLEKLETMTNDMCYDHQIVLHPVSLPAPLFIAGRYSQRGAMVLGFNKPEYTAGEVDLQKTNDKLGYSKKQLFETRFNA